ncbi:MAG TPA: recombinase family protein, partial [bacterium]|nr:recombinase family protein [bacterium]
MSKKENQKPCAIYVRVSTQMQADHGLSIESQIETLKQEAARRGKPVYAVYTDVKSGGSFNRPEFQKLVKDSQKKPPPFDLVITWSVSRFGRNKMESYIATEKLRERGISIFYYKEPFDTEDSMGRLIIEILRAVAEFSRLEYVKDVERSKSHLARNGYSTGGKPPFGLRRKEVLENGKRHIRWEPDPDTAPIAKKIFEMYADGHGYKSICRWLNDRDIKTTWGNKWRAASFSRMLRNEIYIGNIVYNKEVKRKMGRNGGSSDMKPEDEWVRCDGAIEPIVPRELFDKVQLRLKQNDISASLSKNSQYLLSGLIKCGICGNAYFGRTPKKKVKDKVYSYSQYICSKQNRYNEKRDNITLKREWFDEIIVNRLFERILCETNIMERVRNEADEIIQAVEERKKQIETLKAEQKKIDGTLQKYYDAFESGALTPEELKSRLKRHRGRIEEIKLEIKNLQNEISICEVRKESGLEALLKVDFKRLRSLYDELPFEKQKDLLQVFIEKIIIDPEWYEIHYTLPTGFEMDRYEHDSDGSDGGPHGSGNDPEKSGNGCVPEGADKIRKSENGSLVSSPMKNFLSGINGDRTKERRLGSDRKNGKNCGTSRD